MKLKDIIIPATKTSDEYVVKVSHKDRINIINELKAMKRGWQEDMHTQSSNNVWYLFVNYLNGYTISINTGEETFFDEVVVNGK